MTLRQERRSQWRNLALVLLAYLIGILAIYATQRWQFVQLVWMASIVIAVPILSRMLRGIDFQLSRSGSTVSLGVSRTDPEIGSPHVAHLGLLGLINLTALAVLVGEGATPRLWIYAFFVAFLLVVRLLRPLENRLLRRADADGP